MSKAPKSKFTLKKKRPLPAWMGTAYNTENDKDKSTAPTSTASRPRHPLNTETSRPMVNYSTNVSQKKLTVNDIIANSLPFLEFKGTIIYSSSINDCCLLCDDILESLESDKKLYIGFDLEWPVTYQKGNPGKVALIQICVNEQQCYLFHVSAMSEFPGILKSLIEREDIIKVGLNIENDFWKLDKDCDVKAMPIISRSMVELRTLANIKLKSSENWSLDGLVQNVLHCKLNKESSVRCGDWSTYPLTEEQRCYAAVDAFASLRLHTVLSQMK